MTGKIKEETAKMKYKRKNKESDETLIRTAKLLYSKNY